LIIKTVLGAPEMPPTQYEVWCDKPSDKALVEAFGRISQFWQNISRVRTIPNTPPQNLRANSLFDQIAPLLEYDRPDIILLREGQPILVIEITEHGYTGDNPLQRFARVVRAAEMGIPLVHFTPFARTRFDEMLNTDSKTSARHVSWRLFQGFVKLTKIYGVPIVAMDWPVSPRGLPIKPQNDGERRQVFGELIGYAEHLCEHDGEHVLGHQSVLDCEVISRAVAATARMAQQTNVLESEIRIPDVSYDRVCTIISNPRSMVDLIGYEYFMKGKDHKLVALRALNESIIESVETATRVVTGGFQPTYIQQLLPQEFSQKPWLILYSGYEWRSQPNAGIVTNTDILYCRSPLGRTMKDRDQFLAVVWPRVFFNGRHPSRAALLRELDDFVSCRRDTPLKQLVIEKHERQGVPLNHPNYIQYTSKSIGTWAEGKSAARIYRSFCDLVILNDRVLLGNHWKSQ
jgi:hypothetical protein